jgi:hypothetical protein
MPRGHQGCHGKNGLLHEGRNGAVVSLVHHDGARVVLVDISLEPVYFCPSSLKEKLLRFGLNEWSRGEILFDKESILG